MRIISRAEWGAAPPHNPVTPMDMPTPELFLHHTADERGTYLTPAQWVREEQRYHQDTLAWNDIGYSFLVSDDGTVFEGRGAGIWGAHTADHNGVSHGICLLGNYENRPPTDAMLNAAAELIAHGREQGWWQPVPIVGHSAAWATACPGRNVEALLGDINRRANGQPAPAPAPAPAPTPPPAKRQLAVIINNTVDHQLVQRHLGRFHLPVLLPDHREEVAEALIVGAAIRSDRLDVYRYRHWLALGGTGAAATEEALLYARQRLDQRGVADDGLRWVGELL